MINKSKINNQRSIKLLLCPGSGFVTLAQDRSAHATGGTGQTLPACYSRVRVVSGAFPGPGPGPVPVALQTLFFFFFFFPTVLFSSHCVKRPFANRGRKLAEKLAVPEEPRCRSSSKTHQIPWARCVQIPFNSSPCRSVLNTGEKANPRANTLFSPYYHTFLACGSTAASGWGGAGTAGWDPACTHALSSPLLWKQTTGQLFHAAHVGGSPQAE